MALASDPHMVQSGSLANVRTPAGEMAKLPKIPLRLNGRSFELRSQPPDVGEGSVDVYRRLGLSDAQIENLIQEGVVQLAG
jgi:crotonobetainyl-CoA:carnitine CoA-transferase CaiB-like acyl-CoA transferase